MHLEEKQIQLKDGRMCTLRNPRPEDALSAIEYMRITAGETDFLVRYPEEVQVTEEKERGFLQWMVDSERDLMLIAEVDGELVGTSSFSPAGGKLRNRHRCSMGIALLQKVWGQGISMAMFELLFEKAKEAGYEQMELEVVARNERAVALYEKLGFEKFGIRPRAVKQKDGSYDDYLIMVKYL